MSHHRAPRVKRSRPSLPAGLGRLATAGLACVVVTGAAVVVGVAVTPPTETPTDVVALDTVTQPVAVPPPAEVPVEVRPVAGFEAPVTLGEGPGDGSVPRQVEPLEEQSVEDIPDEAAAAYQRAASVMAEARPKCHLEWPVLAAVGRVESDHGQVDGGTLGSDGTVEPARYGATLNGRRGQPEVRDTDAGALDGKRRWDRTMGPFNLLPTTWTVMGVDADSDGRRDPQDIDDAALAAAVVLCGQGHDLAKSPALTAALRNLNPADGYPRAVTTAAGEYATELQELAETEPVVIELPPPDTEPTDAPRTRNARRNPDRDQPRGPRRPKDPPRLGGFH